MSKIVLKNYADWQQDDTNTTFCPKLAILREKGQQALLAQGLPTPKTEAWKYTKLRNLIEEEFIVESGDNGSCHCHDEKCHCHDEHETCGHEHCCCHEGSLPFEVYEVDFCNGKLKTDHFHTPQGLSIVSLTDAFENGDVFKYLNKSFDINNFPFAALNSAYLEQGVMIAVDKNFNDDKPILLNFHSHGDIKRLSNVCNVIVAESGARATILEHYYCSGAEKSVYFNNIVNEFFIGRDAYIRHYKVQQEAFKAFHIALNSVQVKQGGHYESFCLQLGADLSRQETQVVLKEPHAEAEVNAVYKMNGWATLDTTTDIRHIAKETISHQLVKGIIGGQAKGVFQGKIHIAPDAVKTEGYQLHKALLLSDEAEVDVKPELEIFADDVKCSHGAASGELDKEQLFYLQSRGISEDEAKSLLIRAFTDEVVNKISCTAVAEWIKSL